MAVDFRISPIISQDGRFTVTNVTSTAGAPVLGGTNWSISPAAPLTLDDTGGSLQLATAGAYTLTLTQGNDQHSVSVYVVIADFDYEPASGPAPLACNVVGPTPPDGLTASYQWTAGGTHSAATARTQTITFEGAPGDRAVSLAVSYTAAGGESVTVTSSGAATVIEEQIESEGDTARGKWLKFKTPDYFPDNGDQKDVSYLRLGAPPDNESELEKDGAGADLTGNQRHGWYSYTSGNRLEVTDGNREVFIGGRNRFSINNGGLGVFDAEPIYGLYFRSTNEDDPKAAWRKTEWGRQKSDTYTFGDSESFHAGFQFSTFTGLQASINIGGNIGLSASLNLSASAALSMTFAAEHTVSITAGEEISVAKEMDEKAREKITLRTKAGPKQGTAVPKAIMGIGAGMSILSASAGVLAGMVQSGKAGARPDAAATGFAIGGSAAAFAGVMLMAGVEARKVWLDYKSASLKTGYDARMVLDGDKARIGNDLSELLVEGSGDIWLGATDGSAGANLLVEPKQNSVKIMGTVDANYGTLKVLK